LTFPVQDPSRSRLVSVAVASAVIGLAGALEIALALQIDAPTLRLRLVPRIAPAGVGIVVGTAMAAVAILLCPPIVRALPTVAEALEDVPAIDDFEDNFSVTVFSGTPTRSTARGSRQPSSSAETREDQS
jgi:hypothetical protein